MHTPYVLYGAHSRANLRFYLTTKLRNPHYPSEFAVRVSLLSPLVVPKGLEEHLLGLVVKEERPDLAHLPSVSAYTVSFVMSSNATTAGST
jgi:hypothetical protein